MKNLVSFRFVFVLLLSSYHCWVIASSHNHDPTENFIQCLSLYTGNSTSASQVIYTRSNGSFLSVLDFTIQNLRFSTPTTPKPLAIVTPSHVSQVQAAVKCSRKYGLQVRVRSGGHDYEGLSYVSPVPFVLIDLINLNAIIVDVKEKTALVQAGATLGQLYRKIAEKSKTLAFPGGVCPTVGVGGHFSGGGYGLMLRKFGLAADSVIDAHLIDARGNFLTRTTMGEDLFWALRGGGGNFGVVLAWTVRLVPVPPKVTVFGVFRPLIQENATTILHKYQNIADKLPRDLLIDAILLRINSSVVVSFSSLFLGGIDRMLPLVQESFPELGLTRQDCKEMTWIESVLFFHGQKDGVSLDALLDRNNTKTFHKGKSDFVSKPIPDKALAKVAEMFSEDEAQSALMVWIPYGGKMSEIPEDAIPFPHRAGNRFKILYFVDWREAGTEASQRHVNWIRKLHSYMTPYVSKNPRAAYANYRDLDIGSNNYSGRTSVAQASIWGKKYFKNNFNKLVRVKTKADPGNFFRNEQSIPSLASWRKNKDD